MNAAIFGEKTIEVSPWDAPTITDTSPTKKPPLKKTHVTNSPQQKRDAMLREWKKKLEKDFIEKVIPSIKNGDFSEEEREYYLQEAAKKAVLINPSYKFLINSPVTENKTIESSRSGWIQRIREKIFHILRFSTASKEEENVSSNHSIQEPSEAYKNWIKSFETYDKLRDQHADELISQINEAEQAILKARK